MNGRDRHRAVSGEARADGPMQSAATAAARCQSALAHMQEGRNLDALTCCRQALAVDPDHADAFHLLGLLSLEDNQGDLAIAWIARAIRQSPKAEYLTSLASALQRQGRNDEALKALEKAVELKPDEASLWTNLGTGLEGARRLPEALLCFQHAAKLDPRDADALLRGAELLRQSGRLDEARVQLDLCDAMRPQHALTLGIRCLVWHGLKRFDDYLADAQAAYALAPDNAEFCHCVGDALLSLGRVDEALQWTDRTLKLQPSFIPALENRAQALFRLHRFTELLATFDRIRAIDPTNAKAEFDAGCFHLLLGNFEEGWKGREARWRIPTLPHHFPNGPEPVWLGEGNISGKTILVYSDEGFGDAIQFTRYVPLLAERGARVVLAVQEPLVSLLATQPGLAQCVARTQALPPVDVRCPMMSLPFAFGTRLDTIPPPAKLSPEAALVRRWEERLGVRDRLRVGLAWSGSASHLNDTNRSLPLALLASILDLDATFVSLQKDLRPQDRSVLAQTRIVDMTAGLSDFSETAALVSCLDLVITVDTSIAHLVATLGCPTWILLPEIPDYRWMLNRDDRPWYPAARLFRRISGQGYEQTIDRVRAELSTLVSSRESGE